MIPELPNLKDIVFEVKESIAFVRINRPPVNTMTRNTFHEVLDVARYIESNSDGVRALIFTGTGKSFIAGVDVSELEEKAVAELSIIGYRAFTAIENLAVPTIAAINGFAFGAGLELAMACDFRVAADNALLGQPEVRLGIIPGAGGTQRLTKLIGKARASELILLGDPIPAEKAKLWGLVNETVPLEKLENRAVEVAQKVMKNAPIAVRYAKKAISFSEKADLHMGLEFESQCFTSCFHTQDREEGVKAFKEKRTPKFTGK